MFTFDNAGDVAVLIGQVDVKRISIYKLVLKKMQTKLSTNNSSKVSLKNEMLASFWSLCADV